MRGQHPNSRKNLARPKLPETHSTATVRVSGPKEAVEWFSDKNRSASDRGRIVKELFDRVFEGESRYAVPEEKFPPITIKP